MRKTVLITVVMLMIGMAGAASAIDYWGGPPADKWNRGDPGSTVQHWDFNDLTSPFPEFNGNPFGVPVVEFHPLNGWEWGVWDAPMDLNPDGVVTGWHCIEPDGGTITLVIPNTDDLNAYKSIFLQVTSSKSPNDVTVEGHGSNPAGYGSGSWPTNRPHIQWPTTPPAPYNGLWYTYNYGRFIIPNPEFETITLTYPYCSVVDQIVVDTICSNDPVVNEESSWGRVKALFR